MLFLLQVCLEIQTQHQYKYLQARILINFEQNVLVFGNIWRN